ncbi:hypothetical protein [Halorubrum vacuolatum]|uniref:Uncharacterized protein n=1 Tax=Halorubrum vacuolatum TaxID=63740 RepID=A0A238WRN3_HALVU|nr:hypothetical protein [Halorubrum vacuolatum]SNR49147.1 hypothetical protein SAMN06264855_109117 [Halorubrum vacuolatum]
MAEPAFSVLEIIAIAVPLIAIVVFQIFSSNLDERMPDEALKMIGRLLIVTGFLFIVGLVFTLDAILRTSLDSGLLVGTTVLVFGLSFLTMVVLVFPMYLLVKSEDETQQTELSDLSPKTMEEDLEPQSDDNQVETEPEPEVEETE